MFPPSPFNIRQSHSGEQLSAKKLNSIINNIPKSIQGAGGLKVTRSGNKLVYNNTVENTQPYQLIVQQMTMGTEYNDCLACTNYWGQTVYVGKPYMLQATPFHGNTITYLYPTSQDITYNYTDVCIREADDGVDTENQVITPCYYAGELILAGTNIWGIYDTGFVDPTTSNPKPIRWFDLNTCGRCWAAY